MQHCAWRGQETGAWGWVRLIAGWWHLRIHAGVCTSLISWTPLCLHHACSMLSE